MVIRNKNNMLYRWWIISPVMWSNSERGVSWVVDYRQHWALHCSMWLYWCYAQSQYISRHQCTQLQSHTKTNHDFTKR